MTAESALKVVSETNETKGEIQRTPDGRFAEGTCGGPGGSRPGSGRKPQPKDPSLLRQLYDILDESAPRALERLTEFIESPDDKISLKACVEILRRVLPESKLLPTWQEKDKEAEVEQLQVMKDFLEWKRQRDLAEEADGEPESSTVDGPKPSLWKVNLRGRKNENMRIMAKVWTERRSWILGRLSAF